MDRICLLLRQTLPKKLFILNLLVVLSYGLFIDNRSSPLNPISYTEYSIAFVPLSCNSSIYNKYDSKSDSSGCLPKLGDFSNRRIRFDALGSRRGNEEGFVDHYKILSLDKNCTFEDVEERYKSINESLTSLSSIDNKLKNAIDTAYKVLSNKESRLKYDSTYENQNLTPFNNTAVEADYDNSTNVFDSDDEIEISIIDDAEGSEDDGSPEDGNGFGGFFSNLFGLHKKQSSKGRKTKIRNIAMGKRDISCTADVDLKTLILGGTIDLHIDKFIDCDSCNVDDYTAKTFINTCPECKGHGMVTKGKRTQFGFVSTSRTCHTCKGSGIHRSKDCLICDNTGAIFKNTTIKVNIPKESKSGQLIRIKGKGNSGGFFANDGDLFVKLRLQSGGNESIEGDSIITNYDISYLKAILGCEAIVPTFDGNITVKIPKGSQPGDKILVGTYNSMQHFVRLVVRLPEKLSQKELKLLQELDNL